MHPWDGLIGPEEIEIYRRRSAHFLSDQPLGQRPVLMVVGGQYLFTGEIAEPVARAIDKYRYSCGDHAWESLPSIRRLLTRARRDGIPILYTRDHVMPPNPTSQELARGFDFVKEIAPEPGDIVFEKEGYSAFFCTELPSFLIAHGVDSLIVVGGTTSGCVRATVTDAHDYKVRAFVVQECVFDRAVTPHRCSLFDIAAKFASVITLDEMSRKLDQREEGPARGPRR